MALLPDLHIKNYRLFQDFKLERLARVNLIAGRNNVGKSALLEAAYLIGTQNPRGALLRVLEERGERSERRERRGWILHPLFFNYQLAQDCSIEIRAGKRQIKIYALDPQAWAAATERFPPIMRENVETGTAIPIRVEHSEPGLSFDLFINSDGVATNLERYVSGWKHESERVHLIRGTDSLFTRYRELSVLWEEIVLEPPADIVIETLKIIEPGLRNLSFLSERGNVKVLLEGMDRPIFIGSLGDGMYHLLMIAVTLANAQGGLLLLDEVETGFHHSVLVNLWRLLFQSTRNATGAQIIATTHSWDCIAAFSQVWNEVEETEGQFCRLDRVDDQILTEFYSPAELALAVERGIELR